MPPRRSPCICPGRGLGSEAQTQEHASPLPVLSLPGAATGWSLEGVRGPGEPGQEPAADGQWPGGGRGLARDSGPRGGVCLPGLCGAQREAAQVEALTAAELAWHEAICSPGARCPPDSPSESGPVLLALPTQPWHGGHVGCGGEGLQGPWGAGKRPQLGWGQAGEAGATLPGPLGAARPSHSQSEENGCGRLSCPCAPGPADPGGCSLGGVWASLLHGWSAGRRRAGAPGPRQPSPWGVWGAACASRAMLVLRSRELLSGHHHRRGR